MDSFGEWNCTDEIDKCFKVGRRKDGSELCKHEGECSKCQVEKRAEHRRGVVRLVVVTGAERVVFVVEDYLRGLRCLVVMCIILLFFDLIRRSCWLLSCKNCTKVEVSLELIKGRSRRLY